MKASCPKKFLFTQLSAPIIGFLALFLVLILTKEHFRVFFTLEPLSLFLKVGVVIALFLFVLLGSMYVWGRVLVRLGILTKEEAKGYPYSKPWEK